MTGTTTSRLGLYKPDDDDNINVTTDLNNNYDKLDTFTGATVCTSSTRPNAPYSGQSIYETDTGKILVSNGTLPASGSWKDPVANGLAASNITIGGSGGTVTFPGRILSQRSSGTSSALDVQVVGDSTARFNLNQSGKMEWGSGAGARDTNLYRDDIDTLATDGSFLVGGDLTVTGNVSDAANLIMGAWSTYTPTWTASSSNPSLGNGTLVGRYAVIGKTCVLHVNLVAGSTTTFGSGTYSFALPFQAANQGCTYIGNAHLLQTSRYGGQCVISPNATTMSPSFPDAVTPLSPITRHNLMTPTVPLTYASTGQLRMTITYEIA